MATRLRVRLRAVWRDGQMGLLPGGRLEKLRSADLRAAGGNGVASRWPILCAARHQRRTAEPSVPVAQASWYRRDARRIAKRSTLRARWAPGFVAMPHATRKAVYVRGGEHGVRLF